MFGGDASSVFAGDFPPARPVSRWGCGRCLPGGLRLPRGWLRCALQPVCGGSPHVPTIGRSKNILFHIRGNSDARGCTCADRETSYESLSRSEHVLRDGFCLGRCPGRLPSGSHGRVVPARGGSPHRFSCSAVAGCLAVFSFFLEKIHLETSLTTCWAPPLAAERHSAEAPRSALPQVPLPSRASASQLRGRWRPTPEAAPLLCATLAGDGFHEPIFTHASSFFCASPMHLL